MKRFLIILLALLLIPVANVSAQKKKGKKAVSPIIEGRQKVRKTDYEKVWKFTLFNVKSKTAKYFCEFDYTAIPEITAQKKPNWKEFEPVVNFILTNGRAAATFVAVYAINPTITDDEERARLSKRAADTAVASLRAFEDWATAQEMRNKMVFQTAQVDYRYWQGNDFYTMMMPQDSVIPVGVIIALTNKKVELFPNAAAGAQQFKDVKFFPNDATVLDSYKSLIDSLATYIMSNDRFEVLLTGYSDNVGTVAYNRGLSNQRAIEIKKMLLLRGVPEHRIEVVARGEKDPVGDNSTYQGRLANNRVSIKIQ